MRSLADALRSTLAALGIRRGVARAAAVAAWPEVMRETFGPAGKGARALRVDGDTIVVAVASPVIAQELRLRAREVLAALARRAPEAAVRDMRFVPR